MPPFIAPDTDEEIMVDESARTPKRSAPQSTGFVGPDEEIESPWLDAGDIAESAYHAFRDLPTTVPASFYRAKEGLARPDLYSEGAKAAMEAERQLQAQRQAEREAKIISGQSSKVGEALEQGGQSLGFSVGSMAPQVAASAGTGALAGSVLGPEGTAIGGAIGVGAGMLAGGVSAYRMAGNQFLDDAFQQLEARSQTEHGRAMTEEEKTQAYNDLLPIAQNTALWEAGPEAVGNAITAGAGKYIFGFGKKAATNLAEGVLAKVGKKVAVGAGDVAAEIGTETATQLQQGWDQAKMDAYLQGKPMDQVPDPYAGPGGITKASGEVTPAVLGQLGLMGGGAAAVKGVHHTLGGAAAKPNIESQIGEGKTPEQIAEDAAKDKAMKMKDASERAKAAGAPQVGATIDPDNPNSVAPQVVTQTADEAIQEAADRINQELKEAEPQTTTTDEQPTTTPTTQPEGTKSDQADGTTDLAEDQGLVQERPVLAPETPVEASAAVPGDNVAPEAATPVIASESPQLTEKQQDATKVPEFGVPGHRITSVPEFQDFSKNGGWKLHLAVSPENYSAVDRWLHENHRGAYKLLSGGDPGHSDFTIYMGHKDDASEMAKMINDKIGNLLNNPELDGDVGFNDKVGGRFDVQRTGSTKEVPWQHYGREGMPGTEATQNLYMQLSQERRAGNVDRVRDIEGALDRHFKQINKQVEKKYGERYTGKPKPKQEHANPVESPVQAVRSEAPGPPAQVAEGKPSEVQQSSGTQATTPPPKKAQAKAKVETRVPKKKPEAKAPVKAEKFKVERGIKPSTEAVKSQTPESAPVSDTKSEPTRASYYAAQEKDDTPYHEALKGDKGDDPLVGGEKELIDLRDKYRAAEKKVYETQDQHTQSANKGFRAASTTAMRKLAEAFYAKHGGRTDENLNKFQQFVTSEHDAGGTGSNRETLAAQDAAWLARNPKSAEKIQRMVDEAAKAAGYKEVMYHGSPATDITVMKDERAKRGGVFLTKDPEYAKSYTDKYRSGDGSQGRVYKLYVKSENTVTGNHFFHDVVSGVRSEKEVIQDAWERGGDMMEGYRLSENGEIVIDGSFRFPKSSIELARKIGYPITEEKSDGTTHLVDVSKERLDQWKEWLEKEGVKIKETIDPYLKEASEYVVKDPSQIKSADPITRDDSGRIIPIEERFQSTEKDIRYSAKEETDEESEEEPEGTSYSNAEMDTLADDLKIARTDRAERKDLKRIMSMVKINSSRWPEYARRRVDEIVNSESRGGVDEVDQVWVAKRINDLRRERMEAEARIRAGGNTKAELKDLQNHIIKVEGEIAQAMLANRIIGTKAGRILRFRRSIIDEDFTLQGMRKRLMAANGGQEPSEDTERRVERMYKDMSDILAKSAENEAKNKRVSVQDLHKIARGLVEKGAAPKTSIPTEVETGKALSVAKITKSLQKRGFSVGGNLKVEKFGKTDEKGREWWARFNPDGTIDINASNITSDKQLHEKIDHELAHMAAQDASVRKVLEEVMKSKRLSKEDRDSIQKWVNGYKKAGKNIQTEEALVETLRRLSKRADAQFRSSTGSRELRDAWKSIKDAIKRLLAKFGITKVKDSDLSLYAFSALANAEADFKRIDAAREQKELGVKLAAQESTSQSTEEDDAPELEGYIEHAIFKAARETSTPEEFVDKITSDLQSTDGFENITKDQVEEELVNYIEKNFPTRSNLLKRARQERESLRGRDQKDPEVEKAKKRIAAIEKKLKEGDFLRDSKETKQLSVEARELKMKEDKLKHEYYNEILNERRKNRSLMKRFFDGVQDSMNAARALVTSFDLSAVLRQGGFIALSHPIRAAKSIIPMLKAFMSEDSQRRILDEIRSRLNYSLYEQSGLFLADPDNMTLSAMEEAYMSRFIKNMPKVLGGGFVRGSERAYVTFLNKLRADSFDAMHDAFVSNDTPMKVDEAKAISDFINVATGRGHVGLSDKAATGLNTLFFAPRWVASRFNLMFGQPLYHGTTKTRMAVAQEYGRFLAGVATVYTLASLAIGGGDDDDQKKKIETDPRSSDFGKIRLGKTRIDPMGGLLNSTVLLSRVASGKTKTLSGNVRDLRGPNKPRMGDSTWDVISRFARTKLAPVPGAAVNLATGENVIGQKTDALNEAKSLVMPISLRDIKAALIDQGVPLGTALSILSLFGLGLSVYDEKKS